MLTAFVIFLISILIFIFVRAHKREKSNPSLVPPPEFTRVIRIFCLLNISLWPVIFYLIFGGIFLLHRLRTSFLPPNQFYLYPSRDALGVPAMMLGLLYSGYLAQFLLKYLVSNETFATYENWIKEKKKGKDAGNLNYFAKIFIWAYQFICILWTLLNFPVYTSFTSQHLRQMKIGSLTVKTLAYCDIETIFDASGTDLPNGAFWARRIIKVVFKNGSTWSSEDWPASLHPGNFDDVLKALSAGSGKTVTKVSALKE